MLAIERGGWRDTSTDFAVTFAQDELRYYWRRALFEEPARETLTFRNDPVKPRCRCAISARSCRPRASAAPVFTGTARLGGSCRAILSRESQSQRYGSASPEEMTIQD